MKKSALAFTPLLLLVLLTACGGEKSDNSADGKGGDTPKEEKIKPDQSYAKKIYGYTIEGMTWKADEEHVEDKRIHSWGTWSPEKETRERETIQFAIESIDDYNSIKMVNNMDEFQKLYRGETREGDTLIIFMENIAGWDVYQELGYRLAKDDYANGNLYGYIYIKDKALRLTYNISGIADAGKQDELNALFKATLAKAVAALPK